MGCVGSWTFLPLTGGHGAGTFTFVDTDTYEAVAGLRWWRLVTRWGDYALTRIEGRQHLLHRMVLGLAPGDPRKGDHRNHDGLDNRRCNLRIVSNAENGQNRRGAQANNRTSRHRGVSYSAGEGKWKTGVQINGRRYRLGTYENEQEAHRAVLAFRREHMPYSQADQEG